MNNDIRQVAITGRLGGYARKCKMELRAAVRASTSRFHPSPVIVLGNQKAGTSAVAGLLSMATECEVVIDFHREIRLPMFHKVIQGEASFERFAKRNRWEFSKPIVKEPNITHMYDHLRSAFPHAKFIFVVRDPFSNIRSIIQRLSLPPRGNELKHCSNVPRVWRAILQISQDEGGGYIGRFAANWRRCADIFLCNQADMIAVRYEDFRENKRSTIESLARSVGLKVKCNIEQYVNRPFQTAGTEVRDYFEYFGEDNCRTVCRICWPAASEFLYVPVESPLTRSQ